MKTENQIMKKDLHAYLVIDCNGELMGTGQIEADAIESAAKALEQESSEIVEIIEKCQNGYQGEESLFLSSRKEWEEVAGMTVEEYLGQ
jgi:hypothetical protein